MRQPQHHSQKYNGCILADSVGLGKTFSELAVIKYYEMRNRAVLVLCPKKLADNRNTFKSNYKNNPIAESVTQNFFRSPKNIFRRPKIFSAANFFLRRLL